MRSLKGFAYHVALLRVTMLTVLLRVTMLTVLLRKAGLSTTRQPPADVKLIAGCYPDIRRIKIFLINTGNI